MNGNGPHQEPAFLYIEDDKQSRRVMQMMLDKALGYSNITIFETSQDFEVRLDALEEVPDVIFLDIQIGPLDGYAMLEILRTSQRFGKAKIIAMTANVMSHDVEQLQASGFDGLIGKPLMLDIFPELVERILAHEPIWYVP